MKLNLRVLFLMQQGKNSYLTKHPTSPAVGKNSHKPSISYIFHVVGETNAHQTQSPTPHEVGKILSYLSIPHPMQWGNTYS